MRDLDETCRLIVKVRDRGCLPRVRPDDQGLVQISDRFTTEDVGLVIRVIHSEESLSPVTVVMLRGEVIEIPALFLRSVRMGNEGEDQLCCPAKLSLVQEDSLRLEVTLEDHPKGCLAR